MYTFYFYITHFLSLFIALIFFVPTIVYANSPFEKVETNITSDELTYYAEDQKIIFNKDVKVQRPDFELTAEQLIIYLKKQPEQPENAHSKSALPTEMTNSEIQKIVAKNNVRIQQDKHFGTCNVATYTEETGVIVLEGSPILTNGKNSVSGEKILYFTHEQKSEVIGGNSKRVNAKFSTDKKLKGK